MKKSLTCLLSLLVGSTMLVACNKQNENNKLVNKQKQIYELAQDAGYTGTYEEWLDSIQGPIGQAGKDGISVTSVKKTKTVGLVDTYTITFSDGSTTEFTITNGAKGDKGDKGDIGPQGPEGSNNGNNVNLHHIKVDLNDGSETFDMNDVSYGWQILDTIYSKYNDDHEFMNLDKIIIGFNDSKGQYHPVHEFMDKFITDDESYKAVYGSTTITVHFDTKIPGKTIEDTKFNPLKEYCGADLLDLGLDNLEEINANGIFGWEITNLLDASLLNSETQYMFKDMGVKDFDFPIIRDLEDLYVFRNLHEFTFVDILDFYSNFTNNEINLSPVYQYAIKDCEGFMCETEKNSFMIYGDTTTAPVIPSEFKGKPVELVIIEANSTVDYTSLSLPKTLKVGLISADGLKELHIEEESQLYNQKLLLETNVDLFIGDKAVKNVIVPDDIVDLRYSLNNFKNIESIKLGKNVKNIEYSFVNLSGLKNIEVDPSNENYYVPTDSKVLMEKLTDTLIRAANGYKLPDNVREVANFAFSGLTISKLEFTSLEELNEESLIGIGGLTEIVIPTTIQYIGNYLPVDNVTFKFKDTYDSIYDKNLLESVNHIARDNTVIFDCDNNTLEGIPPQDIDIIFNKHDPVFVGDNINLNLQFYPQNDAVNKDVEYVYDKTQLELLEDGTFNVLKTGKVEIKVISKMNSEVSNSIIINVDKITTLADMTNTEGLQEGFVDLNVLKYHNNYMIAQEGDKFYQINCWHNYDQYRNVVRFRIEETTPGMFMVDDNIEPTYIGHKSIQIDFNNLPKFDLQTVQEDFPLEKQVTYEEYISNPKYKKYIDNSNKLVSYEVRGDMSNHSMIRFLKTDDLFIPAQNEIVTYSGVLMPVYDDQNTLCYYNLYIMGQSRNYIQ